jgi:uncharacterized protein YbjT (DUF2867 family)
VSVLLVDVSGELGAAVVSRLVSLADEVRVVEEDPAAAPVWARLGAHVARGASTDTDLLERAAQQVRTVVVAQRAGVALVEVVKAVVEAARLVPGDVRLVVCMRGDADAEEAIRSSGLDYVILRTGKKRARLRRGSRRPSVTMIAEAVDAADDLAGHPSLDVDLTAPGGWRALGLDPPQG